MAQAVALALRSPIPDPNPRVGCVLVGPDGTVIGRGWHRGAGTVHAEVDALRDAGGSAHGATAVVTLEPCDHTGRTGPCSRALIEAGVRRVVIGQQDPNPRATGGAGRLRSAGIEVVEGVLEARARELNPDFTFAMEHGRPRVVWKYAATLDGRSAAADGTSRWITSASARRQVHLERMQCGAILVGTGTALSDDPRLTVRLAPEGDSGLPHCSTGSTGGTGGGSSSVGSVSAVEPCPPPSGRPAETGPRTPPLRVVMGRRELPAGAHLLDDSAPTLRLRTRDPHEALAVLHRRGVHRVWLEGGPTLAGAFLAAGLVDEVVAHLGPLMLGTGRSALGEAGVATIADAHRFRVTGVRMLGPDVEIRAVPDRPDGGDPPVSERPRRGSTDPSPRLSEAADQALPPAAGPVEPPATAD
ncbi:bifunctional diaminohydroxyphosphoribosylaminopyrimidine deaminase/5-amino-6-(5-phosphoribosylamino)uracil reductase RibD, partial [Acidipropionibacterium timonense]|uniref:bifunctional diaminohydroxyphosphoribosylaminopyrimidine deaminase/5-amino-6-(5-phosphoribosylamino)uracil reductase RibD n=1 Tax=Acidipropionibacterium timonense TaxID=2161818 RepID=UPI00102F3841